MEKESNIEDIVAGCIKKDNRHQEALYKYCYTGMMKVCLRYTSDRNEAAALYNASMLKVFSSMQAYQNEGKLLSWIRTIIINTCIDHARQKKTIRFREVEEEHNNTIYVEADALQHISSKEILALITELPETVRMVFNLFAIEGYSHEQISKLLQIPAGTSRWYASEARKLLKGKVEIKFSTAKSLFK